MLLTEWVLKGYVQGKRAAEARLAQLFPNSGVALRPGFIHGTRNVAGIPVPLQIVGRVPFMLLLDRPTLRRDPLGACAHLCITLAGMVE